MNHLWALFFLVACPIIAALIVVAYEIHRARPAPDGYESSSDERWRLGCEQGADVVDARDLPILAESPIFWQTVASLPVAGEMAARFAHDVEVYVAEAAS